MTPSPIPEADLARLTDFAASGDCPLQIETIILDLIAAYRAQQHRPSREDVVRIIEECVWARDEFKDGVRCRVYDGAEQAADAILALFPPPPTEGSQP